MLSRRPDFWYQPIPSSYSDLINHYYENGTPIDASLSDNVVVEDSDVPNYEDTNYRITTDYDNSLDSDFDPSPRTKFWKFKE